MVYTPRSTWLEDKIKELQSQYQSGTANTQAQQEEQAWWQTALSAIGKPFEWLNQKVEKPFASILTAPFSPSTTGTEGMDWLQRQRAEYDAWKAPWGVKGLAENLPLLVAPNVAGAALKGVGVVTGAIKLTTAAEKAAEAAGIASKAVKIGEATDAVIESQNIVAKFMQALPIFKLGTDVQKISYALERSPKISKYLELATKEGLTIEERNAANVALRGSLTKIGISNEELQAFAKTIQGNPKYVRTYNKIVKFLGETPTDVKDLVTAADIDKLGQAAADLVNAGKIESWDYKAINSGLGNLKTYLVDPAMGVKPIRSELNVMAKVFGEDFGKSIAEITTTKGSRFLSRIIDIANIPRAILASTDFSGVLRQGGILFARHPNIGLRSSNTFLKATFSQKAADVVPKLIKENKLFEQGLADGMELLEAGAGTALRGQEVFVSTIAEKLPFVRMSERGYVAGLNKMAWDTYFQEYPKWIKMGATAADTKEMGRMIMQTVGRGTLPKGMDKAGGLLSSMFFAPRLVMSRLQLPMNLFSKSPFVRKEAAKTLAAFLGSGATILSLAKLGGADVNIDPRSADFGKIKMGSTRLDIWTGYAQYTRLVTQLITGQAVSESGNVYQVPRSTVAGRFLQSKASPALGLIVDLLKGETYMGEDTIPKDTGALIEQLKNRIAPLFIQDMMDAINQEGSAGALKALPGILGVGVTTYTNEVKKIKEQIAQEKYQMSWEDVGVKMGEMAQYNLGKDSPELQAALDRQDEQTLGTSAGRFREEGINIETSYEKSINQASMEYAQTGDGVTFREKVNNAAMIRRAMYDQRNQQSDYKDIVASYNKPLTDEQKTKMNPLDIAKHDYQTMMYSDDMTDEFGNYDFDEAARREELFRQKYGDAALKYVKEFIGTKFDAPPIYTELKKAQTILKPYWQVESEIARLRGEYFANSKVGQALIARTKKLLLLRNPDMLRYYKMFYSTAQK